MVGVACWQQWLRTVRLQQLHVHSRFTACAARERSALLISASALAWNPGQGEKRDLLSGLCLAWGSGQRLWGNNLEVPPRWGHPLPLARARSSRTPDFAATRAPTAKVLGCQLPVRLTRQSCTAHGLQKLAYVPQSKDRSIVLSPAHRSRLRRCR